MVLLPCIHVVWLTSLQGPESDTSPLREVNTLHSKFLEWLEMKQSPLLPSTHALCTLSKAPVGLNKTPLFQLELTSWALAQEPQSTTSTDRNTCTCPRSCFFLSLRSTFTSQCSPSRCAVYFLQDLWLMTFSISVSLVVCYWISTYHDYCLDSPSSTLCST